MSWLDPTGRRLAGDVARSAACLLVRESYCKIRPSIVEGGNEGANTLFGTVDALFGTVDREGVENEARANLLLLPPLWSA